MKKLAIIIPVLNQKGCTQSTLSSLKSREKNKNTYIIVDNGSNPPVRDWLDGLSGDDVVIRNSSNVGVPKALNQALSISEADYNFCTHSDIYMFEQDWDQKIIDSIEEHNNVGVAGFFGAMGIGTQEIYKTPYNMGQLVRISTYSGNRCKLKQSMHRQQHFSGLWMKCAVLDGFALIVKKGLKFETKLGAHHMYDNDICLQSIISGFENIIINMDIDHFGGRTDVGEDWSSVFGKTKQQVHQEAHPPFYEKWRSLLPLMV